MARLLLCLSLNAMIVDHAVSDDPEWPAIVAPHIEAEGSMCPLPRQVSEVIVGAHGRFLIARMPTLQTLAVVDVNRLQIAGYVKLQHPDQIVVAGATQFFLIDQTSRNVQRYSFRDLKQVGDVVKLPGKGTIKAAVMGCASEGPLLVVSEQKSRVVQKPQGTGSIGGFSKLQLVAEPSFHDGQTLQPIPVTFQSGSDVTQPDWSKLIQLRAADNGTMFTVFGERLVLKLNDRIATLYSVDVESGSRPGAFGRMYYTAGRQLELGVWTPPNRRSSVRRQPNVQRLPAVGWPGSLVLTTTATGTNAAVHLDEVEKPIGHLVLDKNPIPKDYRGKQFVPLQIWPIPAAKLVAILSHDRRSLKFVPLDVGPMIKESPDPLLLIAGQPGTTVPGATVSFRPTIYSDAKITSARLLFGPEGMTIDDDALISWPVPRTVNGGKSMAVVSISTAKKTQKRVIEFPIGSTAADDSTAAESSLTASQLAIFPGGRRDARDSSSRRNTVAAGPPKSIELPGRVTSGAVGADGRMVILALSKIRKLAVIDLQQHKLVGLLPMTGVFTADQKHVFVVNGSRQQLERYNLDSLRFEAASSLRDMLRDFKKTNRAHPPGRKEEAAYFVGKLQAGRSSTEFMVMNWQFRWTDQSIAVVDSQQLTASPIFGPPNPNRPEASVGLAQVVSPNGRLLWAPYPPVSPGTKSLVFEYQGTWEFTDARYPSIPYAGRTPLEVSRRYFVLPSPTGGPGLQLMPPDPRQPTAGCSVRLVDEMHNLLCEVPGLKPVYPQTPALAHQLRTGQAAWFRPEYKTFAYLSDDRQSLTFAHVDVDQLLKDKPLPPLTTSTAPVMAPAGETYTYQIERYRPEEKVTFQLQSAPPGMTVDEGGRVTWKVPQSVDSQVFYPVVRITSNSHQQPIDHRMTLVVPRFALIQFAEAKRKNELQIRLYQQRQELLEARRTYTGRLRELLDEATEKKREQWKALREAAIAEDNRPLQIPERPPLTDEQRRHQTFGSKQKLQAISQSLKSFRVPRLPVTAQFPGRSDSDGLSWRVHILPSLGYPELHQKFRRNEPWYSVHNRRLINQMPDIFQSDGSAAGAGRSSFVAVRITENAGKWPGMLAVNRLQFSPRGPLQVFGFRGMRLPFPLDQMARLASVRQDSDALGRLLAAAPPTASAVLVEVDDAAAVTWTRPITFDVADGQLTAHGIGLKANGALVVTKEGRVEQLQADVSDRMLQSILTGEAFKQGVDAKTVFTQVEKSSRRSRPLPHLSAFEKVYVPDDAVLTTSVNLNALRQLDLPQAMAAFPFLNKEQKLPQASVCTISHLPLGDVWFVEGDSGSRMVNDLHRLGTIRRIELQRWPMWSDASTDWSTDWSVDLSIFDTGVSVYRQPNVLAMHRGRSEGLTSFLADRAEAEDAEWVSRNTESVLETFFRPQQAERLLAALSDDGATLRKLQPLWTQVQNGHGAISAKDGFRISGSIRLKPNSDPEAVLKACELVRELLLKKWTHQITPTATESSSLAALGIAVLRPTAFQIANHEIRIATTDETPDLLNADPTGSDQVTNTARNASVKAEVQRKLKQLVLAFHAFHDANRRFPMSEERRPGSQFAYSWRIAILTYLNDPLAKKISEQYHFDEPWDSDHNSKVTATMPDVFRAPDDQKPGSVETRFTGFAGLMSALGKDQPVRIRDILDGTVNTILLAEHTKPIPWAKPVDLTADATGELPDLPDSGRQPFFAGFADGNVREIPSDMPEFYLYLLIDRSDGQVLPAFDSPEYPFLRGNPQ